MQVDAGIDHQHADHKPDIRHGQPVDQQIGDHPRDGAERVYDEGKAIDAGGASCEQGHEDDREKGQEGIGAVQKPDEQLTRGDIMPLRVDRVGKSVRDIEHGNNHGHQAQHTEQSNRHRDSLAVGVQAFLQVPQKAKNGYVAGTGRHRVGDQSHGRKGGPSLSHPAHDVRGQGDHGKDQQQAEIHRSALLADTLSQTTGENDQNDNESQCVKSNTEIR